MESRQPSDNHEDKKTADKINFNFRSSREFFHGDINEAVVKSQLATGPVITLEWWLANVGNDGSSEEIIDRYDRAYETYCLEFFGQNEDVEQPEISREGTLDKAEEELARYDDFCQRHPDELDKLCVDLGTTPEQLKYNYQEELVQHLRNEHNLEESDVDSGHIDDWGLKFERQKFDEVLEKYSVETQKVSFEVGEVEVVACGRELEARESEVVSQALDRIVAKIGDEQFAALFKDIKLYAGDDLIEGGGLALPRFNAVLIDLKKIGINIEQMESMLSQTGQYRKGDQSELVDNPGTHEALELSIVHEFGHILEYRSHGDVDRAFTELDQADSPTKYGSESAREDFAESWMYYIYDGDITKSRLSIIQSSIEQDGVTDLS